MHISSQCVWTDTMMKFASFETVVEMIYKHAVPKPKSECDKTTQLGISFAGGYIAGVLCAVVSHPADNLVSFLNNAKGATVGDVSPFFPSFFLLFFKSRTSYHNLGPWYYTYVSTSLFDPVTVGAKVCCFTE